MTLTNFAKTVTVGGALALVAFMGMLLTSQLGSAQNGNDDAARIQRGFAIAPVKLNLAGKNSEQVALVGLGSYLVNAIGDCDGCHYLWGQWNDEKQADIRQLVMKRKKLRSRPCWATR